jgi:glycosyltransferase involved in cell wall biosynthesis
MRILIVAPHRNIVGGIEKYLQAIVPSLITRGHQVALLYETRFNLAQDSIDATELRLPACSITESGEPAALQFALNWRPEVVYSNGLETAGLLAELLSGYPTVLYAHNYLGTCATGQKCHAFPVPRPCHRQFGPACLALHYPRRCGGLNPLTMWTMYQRSAELNRQLPQYAAVLVASDHMRREFERHGVSPDRVHLVPLPNSQECAAIPARRNPPGRILSLSRLTKLKGVGHLLKAIPLASGKLGKQLSLTIAGDGPERGRLQALAQQLGVAAAFPGWISSGKAELFESADLLAVPSLWPEPFGLIGIEAGAYGLPAVAYGVGGIHDWLIPGESGELAPGDPPTVEGLAAAIVRALGDPAHYANLCRGALEVAARFTLQTHLTKLESILDASRHTTSKILAPTAEGIPV